MCYKNFFFRLMPCLLLACLFATGCSNSVSITGRVTYSDNGEPVKSGMVVFAGDKETGRGTIKDGHYSVGLFKDGDGLPPGTYTVAANAEAVMVMESVDMHGNRETTDSGPLEVYYTKEPKTIEVKKAMTYDFAVERGKRP